MSRDSVALEKSKRFSIRIVRLYKYLQSQKYETLISKQLLRSGTSVGANLTEAIYAISDKDFLTKVYISLKECNETQYWLELLYKTDFLSQKEFESINADCVELIKLLTAITKSKQANIKNRTIDKK